MKAKTASAFRTTVIPTPNYHKTAGIGMTENQHVNVVRPKMERNLAGRKIPEVAFPLQDRLSIDKVFERQLKPNLELLRYHFHGEGRLDIACLLKIVHDTTQLLANEENVVHVSGTVKVVGAICGQFYDVLEILEKVNFAEGEKCVFLGKYTWDGTFSTETVLYLYAHKLVYPDHVFLIRSQRETRLFSKTNFKMECQAKYNLEVYEDFSRSFEHLPIVAIVNKCTMCVHGGFSPTALSLDAINQLNRFVEPPPRGALTDILWADPDPNFGQEPASAPCFTFNKERMISVYFTFEAFRNFMTRNGLTCLVRANRPLFEGSRYYCIISVGAMLVFTPTSFRVNKFLWVSSPYWLPNYLDCFTWSLPFLVHKATLFVSDLLELMDRDTAASDVKAALKKNQERSNVLSVQSQEQQQRAACLLIPQRQVIVSTCSDQDMSEEGDDLSLEEEDAPRTTSYKGFFLCCGAQAEQPEDVF